MMTAMRALVRKDIRLFLADPRALIMSFAAPIAIASFFGYALGGSGNQGASSAIPVLLSDQDGSTISRAIATALAAEKSLSLQSATLAEARETVRKGKASVAVIIPQGFGKEAGEAFFRNSGKPEIEVLYDPSRTAERAMVQGILTGDVMQAVSKEMFSGETGIAVLRDSLAEVEGSQNLRPGDKSALLEVLRGALVLNHSQTGGNGFENGLQIPFRTQEEAVTAARGIQYNGYGHAFAGMGVQFVLFLGIEVGVGLLLQRQRGLWKRFRAAPLSRGMLLGSRAASAALMAFAVLLVQFLFARVAFGVRVEGSMAGFLGVAGAFGLMTAGFGLLIAALGKTPDATRGLAIFATLLMVMFGGAWIPMFLFPSWLQTVTLVMPTRWAIDGLEAMTWRGLGFRSAVAPIGVQLLFAAIFLVLAWSRFRWEES